MYSMKTMISDAPSPEASDAAGTATVEDAFDGHMGPLVL